MTARSVDGHRSKDLELESIANAEVDISSTPTTKLTRAEPTAQANFEAG